MKTFLQKKTEPSRSNAVKTGKSAVSALSVPVQMMMPGQEDELVSQSKSAIQKAGTEQDKDPVLKKSIQLTSNALQLAVIGEDNGPVLNEEYGAKTQPMQKQSNHTGMPDNLKAGVENLSGFSMDDVKVHYNSPKPAQLEAFAYAQGTNIHVGPGQEKYLPHEAWHVAQQKQGRVRPTMQMKEGIAVNDDKGLEHEADVMGTKAFAYNDNSLGQQYPIQKKQFSLVSGGVTSKVIQAGGQLGKLNRRTQHNISGPKTSTGGGMWLTETEAANGRHQQVRIGESQEDSYAQSYGLEGEPSLSILNPSASPGKAKPEGVGSGVVYEDRSKPTEMVQFFPMTKEEQQQAIIDLKGSLGFRGDYNLIRYNCVHWSMKKYDELKAETLSKRGGETGFDLPDNFSFEDPSTWK